MKQKTYILTIDRVLVLVFWTIDLEQPLLYQSMKLGQRLSYMFIHFFTTALVVKDEG